MSKNSGNKYTRRDFLKGAAVFGGAFFLALEVFMEITGQFK
jgi:hypothetical protein